ncbi:MAG TPA: glycosyltransferase [Candidatus Paceibacterota bacterium]|nr:glycosyltransferase [Candidatus Paceibacterota bacterium]
MSAELISYPFLFAAIYFEVFLLLTFLSSPARKGRERVVSTSTPTVSLIVPCWNEESTIEGSLNSLLALEYPSDKLSIVVVNDGSTDNSKEVLKAFEGNPRVTIIHKENGGKHTALNTGIAATDAEIVGCMDADSFVEPSALRETVSLFDNPKVGAVTVAMSVHQPKTLIEAMQNVEYILGIALRHILASVNGIYVTPGPFSLYRRTVIEELGGFRSGHHAEDMEMALRLQRNGYWIENAVRARVYAQSPRTVRSLVKQRVRWTTGFLRNVLGEYRDMVGNPRFGTLGLIVLPLGFFAIVGGILLTGVVVYRFIADTVEALLLTNGLPLSYLLTPRFSFDLFYFPVTVFVTLAMVAAIGSVAFIIVGKHISQTPGRLTIGILGWLFLYGLIAPFWLIRSVLDVATGTRRPWR